MVVMDADVVLLSKGDTRVGESAVVSGKTGQGVDQLIKKISNCLQERAATASVMTRERHRIALDKGIAALSEARNDVMDGPDRAEYAAESLRSGVRSLDALVGRVGVEDVLDEVFATFCLGK